MRVVITHQQWGIYLGSFLGLGFWSLLDIVGQPSATTFESEEVAAEYIRTWEENNDPTHYQFIVVEPSDGDYAMAQDLIAAGLDSMVGDLAENDAHLKGIY